MNYWHILSEAHDALAGGDFRAAEAAPETEVAAAGGPMRLRRPTGGDQRAWRRAAPADPDAARAAILSRLVVAGRLAPEDVTAAEAAATAASRQYASAPTASPNSSFSGAPPTSTMYRSRSWRSTMVSITTFMYGIVVVSRADMPRMSGRCSSRAAI